MSHSLEFVGKSSIHFSPGKVHPHPPASISGVPGHAAPRPGVRLRISGESRPPLRSPARIFPFLKGFSPLLLGASLAAKCPGVKKPPVPAHRSGGPWVLRPPDGARTRLDRREPRDAAKGPGQPRQAPQCPGSRRRWGRGAVGAARPWAPLGAEPPAPAAEGGAPGGLISVL